MCWDTYLFLLSKHWPNIQFRVTLRQARTKLQDFQMKPFQLLCFGWRNTKQTNKINNPPWKLMAFINLHRTFSKPNILTHLSSLSCRAFPSVTRKHTFWREEMLCQIKIWHWTELWCFSSGNILKFCLDVCLQYVTQYKLQHCQLRNSTLVPFCFACRKYNHILHSNWFFKWWWKALYFQINDIYLTQMYTLSLHKCHVFRCYLWTFLKLTNKLQESFFWTKDGKKWKIEKYGTEVSGKEIETVAWGADTVWRF